ncbi:MAG: EAL domain-containing protein [Pseudomonadota bacterium]|nr:EAL domain-containing protein [Pseudomonadota bacterium]
MLASTAAADAAFLLDPAGVILTWSPVCAALLGAHDVGDTLAGRLSAASAVELAQLWPSLAAGDLTPRRTVHFVRHDGGVGEAQLSLFPQIAADGTLTACVAHLCVESDISESAMIGRMHLRAIINLLPGTFYVIRADGSMVLWNTTVENVTGRSNEEMRASNAIDMFDITEKGMIAEKIRQVLERDEQVFVEATLYNTAGVGTPYLLTGARIECKGKYYVCGMGLDISLRHRQEQQLRLRERALHAASNGILITSCNGADNLIDYVNPAFERITGYLLDEVRGRDARFMAAPGGLDAEARATLRLAIDQRREGHVTFRNQRKSGELFWNDLTITPVADENGRVTHFIGVINDVTALRQRTARLEHEVNHDALTGLANRTLLWERLDEAIFTAKRNKSLVATLLMDLNGFKRINDTFGHEAGDEVLTAVARRLLSSVRDSDTVARLSGDEFVLVLVDQPSLRFTLRMVDRLRQRLTRPVIFNNIEIPVSAAIGISVYPHDGDNAFELVRAADVAMYHAKANEQSNANFFSPDMKATGEAKLRLEDAMRGAIDKHELFLVFQPSLSLRSGRVAGFEALLRWNHPEQGLLLPAAFLAEAEENGMIVDFGALALEHACAFLQRLAGAGFADLPVSVNVAQREYARPGYVAHVAQVLARCRLAPASLAVELREEGLVRNHHVGAEVLGQLNELGVLRSVDAFGNGLSDLNFLQRLPLTHVKLAQLAVHQISSVPRSGAMAKSLLDIGHNMNVTVIAEGVETRQQMDFLKTNGCDQMQGLYYHAPLSADAAVQLLRQAAGA